MMYRFSQYPVIAHHDGADFLFWVASSGLHQEVCRRKSESVFVPFLRDAEGLDLLHSNEIISQAHFGLCQLLLMDDRGVKSERVLALESTLLHALDPSSSEENCTHNEQVQKSEASLSTSKTSLTTIAIKILQGV